jgi:hypothetical protein
MANERAVGVANNGRIPAVYEIPNFWTITVMGLGVNLLFAVGMEILGWYRGFPLWIPIVIYGFLFAYGLGRLRDAPYRVEVSSRQLTFVRPFRGVLDVPWERVRSIRLIRRGYTRGKIEHARLAVEGIPTLILTPRIRHFDLLIDELCTLHPELIAPTT